MTTTDAEWLSRFLAMLKDPRAKICSPSFLKMTIRRIEKRLDKASRHCEFLSRWDWSITITSTITGSLSRRARKSLETVLDGKDYVTIPVSHLRGCCDGIGEKTFNKIAEACGSDIRCKGYEYFRVTTER